MVGAKQFDPAAALDRALAVFWHKGYEATSIQDLELATGLGRGSLYNAFKDKESLFLEALPCVEGDNEDLLRVLPMEQEAIGEESGAGIRLGVPREWDTHRQILDRPLVSRGQQILRRRGQDAQQPIGVGRGAVVERQRHALDLCTVDGIIGLGEPDVPGECADREGEQA